MLTPEKIEELRALLAKATPGPWEADNENNDGCYGLGDDCHEGFQSASIHAPDGRGGYIKLFDALNSDAACIEEEWDEDQHYAWDEVSRANAALIVAMRNALPALLDLASKAPATLSLAGEDAGGLLQALDAANYSLTDKAAALIRSLSLRVEAEKRAREEAERWKGILHKQVDDFAERYAQAGQDANKLRVDLRSAETHSAALARALEEATSRAYAALVTARAYVREDMCFEVDENDCAQTPEFTLQEINAALQVIDRARSLLAPKEDTDA